jgi:hypothetical protein
VTPQSPNSAFTVTDGCTHSRLPPHGTCGLTAQFQPSTLGTSSQTLLVQESHGGSTEVTLTGTGYIELTVTLNGPNEVASDNHGLICADPQTSSTNCTTPLTSLSEQLTGHYGSVASPSTPPSPSNLLSLSWTGDCISAPSDRPVCTISKLPDGPPRGLTATLGPSGTPYPG